MYVYTEYGAQIKKDYGLTGKAGEVATFGGEPLKKDQYPAQRWLELGFIEELKEKSRV